ncbi:MAG: hypothetical protein WKF75_03970 [Singulisphaera sp.]
MSRRSSAGSTRPRPNIARQRRLTVTLAKYRFSGVVSHRANAARPSPSGSRSRSPGIRGMAGTPVLGLVTAPRVVTLTSRPRSRRAKTAASP